MNAPAAVVAGPNGTADSFLRGLRIAVAVIAAAVLIPSGLLRNLDVYDPLAVQLLAYGVLVGVVVVEVVLLALGRTWGALRVPALALVAGASVAALWSVPPEESLSAANWAFGAVGWSGLVLVLDRPVQWLGVVLALHETHVVVTTLVLRPAPVETLNLIVASIGAIGFPLAGGLAAVVLQQVAAIADDDAAAAERARTAAAVSARLDVARRDRLAALDEAATPLLRGLADRSLHPRDPSVQRRAAIEASRLRRLLAEVDDDVPDALLHELRHIADVAERRGVLVELETRGHWPDPPIEVRRALTDAAATALVTADTTARATIVGVGRLLAVSVVADGPPPRLDAAGSFSTADIAVTVARDENAGRNWVEARWTMPSR